jgi:hypothetical protein
MWSTPCRIHGNDETARSRNWIAALQTLVASGQAAGLPRDAIQLFGSQYQYSSNQDVEAARLFFHIGTVPGGFFYNSVEKVFTDAYIFYKSLLPDEEE